LRQAGIVVTQEPAFNEAREAHEAFLQQAEAVRAELANLETQREATQKKLDRGDRLFNKFLSTAAPADLKASLNDLELPRSHQQMKLEELGPQIDAAKQKVDFFHKDYSGKLGDYLNDPENSRRLFDPTYSESDAPLRAQLLDQLIERLDKLEILYHILAS